MADATRSDLVLGIVGTGAMGTGIAQIAAAAGVEVLLFDAREGAAEKARTSVIGTFDMLASKNKMSADAAKAAGAKLKPIASLGALKGADIVVEAIVEEIGAKQALFSQLEPIVGDECLLATNTSSLSVTAIAAKCKRPGRVGGFHFFNPVPLMKVVEVIDGVLTEAWVGDALMALAKRMGHFPARTKDTPGFIVNHAGRGFGTEALRLAQEGVADFVEIDRIMREVAGFRMGPFELLDLTALDVSHPVMESIYEQYYQEPRFRPSPITRQRLAAGLLGRKTGRGFYTYKDAKPLAVPVPPAPKAKIPPVWISPVAEDWRTALAALVTRLGATLDPNERPNESSLCLVTPLGEDATTSALSQGLDARRVVAVDMLFGLDKRRTLMTTPVTDGAMRDGAHALFAADSVPVSVIHDSPGFVAPRIVAQIVNIGCEIAQQRIATPGDLDQAVKLGLGYPQGPLGLGDTLGPQRVLLILKALHAITGDPRYRPSVWLTRRALLGVSLTTPEG
jgi:3-hydroxybutyryl-CoA dehydrogenase